MQTVRNSFLESVKDKIRMESKNELWRIYAIYNKKYR